MNGNAFLPQGPTVLVAATSSTGVAATQISTANVNAAMLSNGTTVPIYALLGSSAVAAAAPTTTVSSNGGMCIPAGRMVMTSIAPSSAGNWISAVTSAGAAAPGLHATPGAGI